MGKTKRSNPERKKGTRSQFPSVKTFCQLDKCKLNNSNGMVKFSTSAYVLHPPGLPKIGGETTLQVQVLLWR